MKTPMIILLSIVITACNPFNQNKRPIHETQETPSSIENKNYEIGSFSRSGNRNIVDRLFEEAKETDPELKNTIQNIENLVFEIHKKEKEIAKYQDNNKNYFKSAANICEHIQQAEIKASISQIVNEAEQKYNIEREAKLIFALSELKSLTTMLNDYISAAKIKVTLKMIENYQKNEIPSTEDIEQLAAKVNKIYTN